MRRPGRPLSSRLDVRRCWEAADRQDKERGRCQGLIMKLLGEFNSTTFCREPEQEPFLGETHNCLSSGASLDLQIIEGSC